MVQCLLEKDGWWLTSWLDATVKVGDYVTLKGEEGWWRIMRCSRPVERASIRRGWKNDI